MARLSVAQGPCSAVLPLRISKVPVLLCQPVQLTQYLSVNVKQKISTKKEPL